MASTLGFSVREKREVGARAAASRIMWYPREDAYVTIERGFLVLEMFDCAVRAKRDGASCGARGRFRRRIF